MAKLLSNSKGAIEAGRFKIPYRIYGSGDNIICLNGAQQSSAMWISFIRHFADTYRITLFDFPYQGKAKVKEGPASISLDEQVDILHRVINQLKIEKPTICSASWGGVVALAFVLRYPKEAKRLILASIGLRPNDKMCSAILEGVNIKKDDRKKMAQVLIDSFGKKLPPKVKNQIINQFKMMSDERLKAFSEHGLSVLLKGSLDQILPLRKIKTSIMILHGKEDMIIDRKDAEKLADKLPAGKIKTVDNVGHFLHMEDKKVLKVYEDILLS